MCARVQTHRDDVGVYIDLVSYTIRKLYRPEDADIYIKMLERTRMVARRIAYVFVSCGASVRPALWEGVLCGDLVHDKTKNMRLAS